jgi:hypothetical protein
MTKANASNIPMNDEQLDRVNGGAKASYSPIMKEYFYPADPAKVVMRPKTPEEFDRFRTDLGEGRIVDMSAPRATWG